MSNIVIILNDRKLDVAALGELHKILGTSLGQLKLAITNGKPILEMELFDGQYEEKAARLRKIIGFIKRYSLNSDIFELPSGQSVENSGVLQESLINLEILENILRLSDDEMDRQLDM